MKMNLQNSQSATPSFLHAMRAAGLALAALLLPLGALAQDQRQCSNATLKGRYGTIISGVRSFGGVTENFVGISLRNFDGNGNFIEESVSFHGAITGVQTGTVPQPPGTFFSIPIPSGTYHVNPDCTGTSTLFPPQNLPPGVEIPNIVSNFVIVDNGKEIREIVISPAPNIVIANYKRLI
jgi:hypothetical protein